jgi:hypothetical protein
VLGLCIVSAAAAIYFILKLDLPFRELMQVSTEGLRTALQ